MEEGSGKKLEKVEERCNVVMSKENKMGERGVLEDYETY